VGSIGGPTGDLALAAGRADKEGRYCALASLMLFDLQEVIHHPLAARLLGRTSLFHRDEVRAFRQAALSAKKRGGNRRTKQRGLSVSASNRQLLKVKSPQIVVDRDVLEDLITSPIRSLRLYGLDVDASAVGNLAHQVFLSVGRETPHTVAGDRDYYIHFISEMADLNARLARSTVPDFQLATDAGEMLDSVTCIGPESAVGRSWGVVDFERKSTIYFVYEQMKAGPRFWKNTKGEPVQSRKQGRQRGPGYRLCAFADFLVRQWRRIGASNYRTNKARRCRSPVMMTKLYRVCHDYRCRKNLYLWRERLQTR
jgi:hypothetical protein